MLVENRSSDAMPCRRYRTRISGKSQRDKMLVENRSSDAMPCRRYGTFIPRLGVKGIVPTARSLRGGNVFYRREVPLGL